MLGQNPAIHVFVDFDTAKAIRSAILGHPRPGFRRFISRTALISFSVGPSAQK
jgi:hypothetical protein